MLAGASGAERESHEEDSRASALASATGTFALTSKADDFYINGIYLHENEGLECEVMLEHGR